MRDITWRRGPSVTRQMASHLRNNASINPTAKRTSGAFPTAVSTLGRDSNSPDPLNRGCGHIFRTRKYRGISYSPVKTVTSLSRRVGNRSCELPSTAAHPPYAPDAPSSLADGFFKILPSALRPAERRGELLARKPRNLRGNSLNGVSGFCSGRGLFIRAMEVLAANQIARLHGVSRSRGTAGGRKQW